MRTETKRFVLFLAVTVAAGRVSRAADGGLMLLQSPGARPAALAEAYSAMTDDAAAIAYNPAALRSLRRAHALFSYEKGLIDDTHGQFSIGAPWKNRGFGLSVGLYDAGEVERRENGARSTVSAQKDTAVALGTAWALGRGSIGVSAKYLSSTLLGRYSARAYAADFGAQFPVGGRFTLGAAAQNFGTELKYGREGDSLPRVLRAGAAMTAALGAAPVQVLIDAPYYINDGELRPAAGVEISHGVLAGRLGYRFRDDDRSLTLGLGISMNALGFDYSYGLADALDAAHRLSVSLRFGGAAAPALAREPVQPAARQEKARAHRLEEKPASTSWVGVRKHRVYQVRPGDTLAAIAQRMYGDRGAWRRIHAANKSRIDDPANLKAGMSIVLP